MHKTLWILALSSCALSGAVQADVLAMPETSSMVEAAPADVIDMPNKGSSMANVMENFGKPLAQHKPAGGESPRHPAITRWDYDGFSVFFEHGKVIDSVNHSSPAKIHHTEELKPLEY